MFNLTIIAFMTTLLGSRSAAANFVGLAHLTSFLALFVGFCLTLLGLWWLLFSQNNDAEGLSRAWPFTLGSVTTYLAASQTATAFMHEYPRSRDSDERPHVNEHAKGWPPSKPSDPPLYLAKNNGESDQRRSLNPNIGLLKQVLSVGWADRRSFELNYENNILFYDPALTADMRRRQQSYIAKSHPVTSEMVAGWTWRDRLWNNAIAMLGPVL
jgi:hypothetical protein